MKLCHYTILLKLLYSDAANIKCLTVLTAFGCQLSAIWLPNIFSFFWRGGGGALNENVTNLSLFLCI